MITAKQANTLTKLSIAKKALERAIDAFNDNIVKNPDTPRLYCCRFRKIFE